MPADSVSATAAFPVIGLDFIAGTRLQSSASFLPSSTLSDSTESSGGKNSIPKARLASILYCSTAAVVCMLYILYSYTRLQEIVFFSPDTNSQAKNIQSVYDLNGRTFVAFYLTNFWLFQLMHTYFV